jgi:hypothetical protein
MMRRVLVAIVAGAVLVTVAVRADADDEATAAPGRVFTLPVVVVHGRVPRPLVVIDLRQPTAAHEAGAAHDTMRDAWLRASVPATLRGTDW